MELQIYSPTQDGFVKEITWNHEEIKKEIAEKISYYTGLVYTEEQIQDAKADRAKLRKFIDALETKRKEIKKQCLAPYEAFEKQMKEIIEMVNKPILMIDGQVKKYEEGQKEEKLKKIKDYWQEVLQTGQIPAGITFNHFFSEKWLNASVSMKAIKDEFNAKLQQFENDLTVIEKLPFFAFEAKEAYLDTLDLSKAVGEAYRLKEAAERKAAWEAEQAKRKAEAETIRPVEPVDIPCTPYGAETAPEQAEPQKQWVRFQALLSPEDAKALGEFLRSRNIEYKPI